MSPFFRIALMIMGALLGLLGSDCANSSEGKKPDRLQGVYIDEMLDAEVPRDISFMDDSGGRVTFADILTGDIPVLLTLNYSDCPGLCVAQLNGLVRGINEVGSLRLGRDFKMVSLSINPRESLERASATKKRYASDLENQHEAKAWRFLIGTEKDIQKITQAIGFHYTYDAQHDRYNHASAAVFLSPKGRVTRYLYEVGFTGDTLKMALIEAGQGKIGSTLDAFVLMCFHFDANENRYSANAKAILSVTAGLFVMIGFCALLPFWISRRRTSQATNSGVTDGD